MGKNLWGIRSAEYLEDGSAVLMSEEAHYWYKEREHECYAEDIIAHRSLVLNGLDVSVDLKYVFEIFKQRVSWEDYPLYLNVDLKSNYSILISSFNKPVDISHRWREMIVKELL